MKINSLLCNCYHTSLFDLPANILCMLVISMFGVAAKADGIQQVFEVHFSPNVIVRLDTDTWKENRPANLLIEFRNTNKDELFVLKPVISDIAVSTKSNSLVSISGRDWLAGMTGTTRGVLRVSKSETPSFSFPMHQLFRVAESGDARIMYNVMLTTRDALDGSAEFKSVHYIGCFDIVVERSGDSDLDNKLLDQLSDRLQRNDSRQSALEELLFFSSERAARMMIDATLLDRLDFDSRRAIVNRLSQYHIENTVGYLVEVINLNAGDDLSVYTLQILARRHANARDTLGKETLIDYLDSEYPNLQIVAMQQLVAIYRVDAIPMIRHLIDDDDQTVKKTAEALIEQTTR